MNKGELVDAFAKKTHASKAFSEVAINAIFDVIAEALSSGDKVQIVGFGSFEIKERAPRVGRNPIENTPVCIPARKVPTFRAGKWLKDLVQ